MSTHPVHKRLVMYALLAFCITSCASNPQRPPDIRIVPVPPELTAPVPEPQLQGDTNAALVRWIDAWREALRLANKRLESIGNIKPE